MPQASFDKKKVTQILFTKGKPTWSTMSIKKKKKKVLFKLKG